VASSNFYVLHVAFVFTYSWTSSQRIVTKGLFATCHYWRLNDPFCCIHRSRNSQCFSMVWKTVKNCELPWFFWRPTNEPPKWHLNWFSCFCKNHGRDQQTDHTTVAIGHIYLVIAAIWPKMLFNIFAKNGNNFKAIVDFVEAKFQCFSLGQIAPKNCPFPFGYL